MKDKTFVIILTAVVILGIICTVALVAYTIASYFNASIISFIGQEVW